MESRGEEGGSAGDTATSPIVLSLTVKFSGRSIPVSLSSDSTVKDLKSLLQPLTNVLPRGQKLIFKGKVLVDNLSLKSSDIPNGSKLMLMASQGLHQGDGPITKDKEAPTASSLTRPTNQGDRPMVGKKIEATVDKTQSQRWKLTGVIALSDSQLKVVPAEVWDCGSSVRLLDLGKNFIREVPAKLGDLTSLQKLLLHANCIVDEHFSWEGVTSLKSLRVLSLNHNYLTAIPSSIGSLTSLRELHVANNKLRSLPVEIGELSQLQILEANNNRISTVPSCIGRCSSLIEIDLSSNLLVDLPETFGDLQNLQALHLRNNGLKSLPSTLFKLCSKLSTLDLHGTEITIDLLRQFEGWENFDERRRSKLQKQLDFRIGCSEGFDEGADKD
ncbi:Lrr repeats and ubiquitin-like domain-containing protein [Thalictrum thalictroides]|uniref:Lrr repeats and ubiquitin-like domain-containing protein n=1 Tax=Thalictrum thalictroides TaxID=46969 RepID=A0A7J6VUB8_THATH|nr:Lrr repeats and ubiquitin-like domain-containing protein [Thalictrum thalictroides]